MESRRIGSARRGALKMYSFVSTGSLTNGLRVLHRMHTSGGGIMSDICRTSLVVEYACPLMASMMKFMNSANCMNYY